MKNKKAVFKETGFSTTTNNAGVKDIIETEKGTVEFNWVISDDVPNDNVKVMQVSGYCFDDQNRILIVKNKSGYWAIPGGHPTEGECCLDTLKREVAEEACVIIKAPLVIGYERVKEGDGSEIYQVRYFCRINQILPFNPEFEISQRKFIPAEQLGVYLNWWNKSSCGKAELKAARRCL